VTAESKAPAEAGGTRLTVATRFATEAERNAFADMGMVEGWNQSLDRLEAETARMGRG
jgi:hypothetical protein